MDFQPNWLSSRMPVAGFILETLVVFIAVIIPIALFNGGLGILVSGGMVIYYLKRRDKSETADGAVAEPDPRFAKFRFLRGAATLLAFGALSLLPILAWILWAFPSIFQSSASGLPAWLSFSGTLWTISGLMLGSLLAGGLAIASLREHGESFDRCYRRVLAGRVWDALRPAVSQFSMCFGMMGFVAVFSSIPGLIRLFEQIMKNSRYPESWEMAIVIPAVPIWIYACIVLLVLFRKLNIEEAAAGRNGRTELASSRISPLFACSAMSAGAAATLGAIGTVMHLGVFAAFGPVAEIGPMATVAAELGSWVEEQHQGGRPSRQIVAALQDQGRWAPGSPDSGLVELMPTLKTGKSLEAIHSSTCRFTIDAGVADLEELRDIEWLPEDEAAQPVKYCLAISCPSPTRWPEDTTLSLYSSHSSRNRYWMSARYIDLFARGPAEPGGYCTTSGELAEHFQG